MCCISGLLLSVPVSMPVMLPDVCTGSHRTALCVATGDGSVGAAAAAAAGGELRSCRAWF
jgi:hypothetical protein